MVTRNNTVTKENGNLLFPIPVDGIYAIAGISKNSGKTAFLNYLSAQLETRKLGILTTGRDGEDKDVVFGNAKPAVRLNRGTLFTTLPEVLAKLGSAVKILRKLPHTVAGKPLWLLEALRDLETEITGPSTAAAQVQTAEYMQSLGAQTIIIDGSLDRKSIALHPRVAGVYLVAGGSFGTLDKIEDELDRLISLAQLPIFQDCNLLTAREFIQLRKKGNWQKTELTSLLSNVPQLADLMGSLKPDGIYLPTALTDNLITELKPLLKGISDVVLRHPLLMHCSLPLLQSLARTHHLYCLRNFNLLALVLNSWSIQGNHLDSAAFRTAIRSKYPQMPVLDIYEQSFCQS